MRRLKKLITRRVLIAGVVTLLALGVTSPAVRADYLFDAVANTISIACQCDARAWAALDYATICAILSYLGFASLAIIFEFGW